MTRRRVLPVLLACMLWQTWPAASGNLVPFAGTWEGVTVSAVPTEDPFVVLVTSAGTGVATHLGAFEMVSPHLTFLQTGMVQGHQIFTAANGDTLEATIEGQFVPQADGSLAATLTGVIVGGTGLRAGATGSYAFHIVSRPLASGGFHSVATFQGSITAPEL